MAAARRGKTLYLFRHAKSSWDDPTLEDFDRPLNKRGEKAAPLMGNVMRARGVFPDLILSSPAKRTRQTAKLALKMAGMDEAEIVFDDRLFHASPNGLLKIVKSTDQLLGAIMIFGHNPGLSEFVHLLTGVEEVFPTAALACIQLKSQNWSEAGSRTGKLDWIVRPKEIVR